MSIKTRAMKAVFMVGDYYKERIAFSNASWTPIW